METLKVENVPTQLTEIEAEYFPEDEPYMGWDYVTESDCWILGRTERVERYGTFLAHIELVDSGNRYFRDPQLIMG